jgi:hypothetical protein
MDEFVESILLGITLSGLFIGFLIILISTTIKIFEIKQRLRLIEIDLNYIQLKALLKLREERYNRD